MIIGDTNCYLVPLYVMYSKNDFCIRLSLNYISYMILQQRTALGSILLSWLTDHDTTCTVPTGKLHDHDLFTNMDIVSVRKRKG